MSFFAFARLLPTFTFIEIGHILNWSTPEIQHRKKDPKVTKYASFFYLKDAISHFSISLHGFEYLWFTSESEIFNCVNYF